MDETTLTIGQLAQRFGLKTSAIGYYESGERRYGADAVRRLEVLDVAKRRGFSPRRGTGAAAERRHRLAGL